MNREIDIYRFNYPLKILASKFLYNFKYIDIEIFSEKNSISHRNDLREFIGDCKLIKIYFRNPF